MQRARSSSNIPLPKFKRSLSSECLRDPQIKQGLKRSNSSIYLAANSVRSSIRTSDLNTDYGKSHTTASASKPASSYKRSINTPLRTVVGSTCLPRRTTATPLRSGGRLASPAQTLTSQKINDKQFSHEQFRKICTFLEDCIDDFDPKVLKSLTLSAFVNIVTLLFKEIDPRIKINMENYKETVLKYMKLYKYPGPVSISMLKSANTSLSRAPIMAMFGWLVDLIRHSNGEEYEDDNLRKYIALCSQEKIKGTDTKNLFVNYIDEVLGLDRHEYDVLSSECEKFDNEKNHKKKIVEELKSKENNLSKELERMQMEIKEFKEGNLEAKIKNEINHLKTECDKRELKIEEMKCSIMKTKEIISSQKYSLKDKQDLVKTLEDLHYSLDIKNKKLESIKKLKDEYDYKQTNFRRQIEAEIHEINERLLELKLVLIDADAKKIQLPDRGIHTPQFLEAVEEKKQLLQAFKNKVELQLTDTDKVLDEKRKEWEVVSNDLSEREKKIVSLEEDLKKISVESERVIFENDITIQKLNKKIAALKETAPDVESLRKQKIDLQKELTLLEEEIQQLSKHYVDIFKKLRADAELAGAEMRNIMADIYEKSFNAYQVVQRKMSAFIDTPIDGPHQKDDDEVQ